MLPCCSVRSSQALLRSHRMAKLCSDRERAAQIQNRNEEARLARLLDHLSLSQRLGARAIEQQRQVFGIKRARAIRPQPREPSPPPQVTSPAQKTRPHRTVTSVLRTGNRRQDVSYFFHHELPPNDFRAGTSAQGSPGAGISTPGPLGNARRPVLT